MADWKSGLKGLRIGVLEGLGVGVLKGLTAEVDAVENEGLEVVDDEK